MKQATLITLALLAFSGVGLAAMTDLDSAQYDGKINIRKSHKAIDANFATIEGTAGTVNGATVTATENPSGVMTTVITLEDTPVVVVGATGVGFGGVKIYDLPAGAIQVLGVTVDSLIVTVDTNTLDAADGGDWSLGSTIADDATITGTDVDFCPSTSADPINGTNSAMLAATATIGAGSTASDINLNMLIDDADIAGTATNTVDATITINWINLGSY